MTDDKQWRLFLSSLLLQANKNILDMELKAKKASVIRGLLFFVQFVVLLAVPMILGVALTSVGVWILTAICCVAIVLCLAILATVGEEIFLWASVCSLLFALILLSVHYRTVIFAIHS